MLQSNGTTDVAVTSLKLNLETDPALLMLTFLHTGHIPNATLNDLPRLFEAAKRFEIVALTEACQNKLVDLADVKDKDVMLSIQAMELEFGSNQRLDDLLRDYHCESRAFSETDYTAPDNHYGDGDKREEAAEEDDN